MPVLQGQLNTHKLNKMGNGMNKILPGLYVGNFRDAKNVEQLKENNITHILSIHDNAKEILEDKIYHCVLASDSASQDLTPFFEECVDFIHKARLDGGGVLVHCLAGVSRSVTITAAYIMTVTSLGWREAIKTIRCSRDCANPNYGFQRQLQQFEAENVEQERQRLKKKFGESPFKDEEECHKLMASANLPSWRDEGLYPLPPRAYQSGESGASGPNKSQSSDDKTSAEGAG